MTNRELINEILRNHPEVTEVYISSGTPLFACFVLNGAAIMIDYAIAHPNIINIIGIDKLLNGSQIWEIPWADLCDPSWTAESFVAELKHKIQQKVDSGVEYRTTIIDIWPRASRC